MTWKRLLSYRPSRKAVLVTFAAIICLGGIGFAVRYYLDYRFIRGLEADGFFDQTYHNEELGITVRYPKGSAPVVQSSPDWVRPAEHWEIVSFPPRERMMYTGGFGVSSLSYSDFESMKQQVLEDASHPSPPSDDCFEIIGTIKSEYETKINGIPAYVIVERWCRFEFSTDTQLRTGVYVFNRGRLFQFLNGDDDISPQRFIRLLNRSVSFDN